MSKLKQIILFFVNQPPRDIVEKYTPQCSPQLRTADYHVQVETYMSR